MSRRLGILATIILLLFGAVVVQAANIQFFKASSLNSNPLNTRIYLATTEFARGQIIAADGTVLAESVPQASAFYPWRRIYPLGSLTSGVVGISSPWYGDFGGVESAYRNYLTAHAQPPQSFEQLLAPTSAADSLKLTIVPQLQRIARTKMLGENAAEVVLNPKTGAVLSMYANPNYNPLPLTSPDQAVAAAAWKLDNKNNSDGFPPLGLVATQQTFPPGSTFKVITTSAVVARMPSLLTKYYPVESATQLPNSPLLLHNSGGSACGGTIAEMLPPSCDPGFALVGLDVGAGNLAAIANSFGYNKVPPIDIPGAVASYFPPAASFSSNLPGLAYSAIGQENVRSSALQNALIAAAIANKGIEMTPHLLNFISAPDGSIVKRYVPKMWLHPLTLAQAQQIVPLMVNVVKVGTLSGVGFLASDNVAGKTGTAQTGNAQKNTDDWVIAFAPANDPTIAVAVVVPFQPTANFGATVAGPIAKCLVEGALAIQAGQRPSGTSTTCAP